MALILHKASGNGAIATELRLNRDVMNEMLVELKRIKLANSILVNTDLDKETV